jgi:hypothetical protein
MENDNVLEISKIDLIKMVRAILSNISLLEAKTVVEFFLKAQGFTEKNAVSYYFDAQDLVNFSRFIGAIGSGEIAFEEEPMGSAKLVWSNPREVTIDDVAKIVRGY